MAGRLRAGIVTLALGALFAAPALLDAQEVGGRMRVFVPNLLPQQDAKDNFGKDVAEELRDLLDEFDTHTAIPRREVRTALRRFDVDEDDLNCIRSRQLAGQIDGGLVLCGEYTPVGNDRFQVAARFVGVQDGETFEVEPVEVHKDEKDRTARHIIDSFRTFTDQLRSARICSDYFQSQQWENALTNCDRALGLNPSAVHPRYLKGRILMELERWEESIEHLDMVLEQNPIHEAALQTAGYVSARMGDRRAAQDYYRQYLELQPGNASVRMNVAYELANAGDPRGAMALIDEGLELDSTNINLWTQKGNFAFLAAVEEVGTVRETEDDEISPEVRELYGTAVDAYMRVFESEEGELQETQLRNIVAAHLQLGDMDEAIRFVDRALEGHPESGALWAIKADALQRRGDLDAAIAALDSLEEIDPQYQNLAVRRGNWLLQAGRVDEAIPHLRAAVERGEQPVDVVAQLILSHGHSEGVSKQRWQYALDVLGHADRFEVGSNMKAQLDFWTGYALYKRAEALQQPQTRATAEQTLPMFRRALALFRASEPYASQQPSIDLNQFVSAANQFIEIQEAVLGQGR